MSKAILIILAVLLPPLSAYLKTKSAKDTVINLILCFFFYVPGVLHALYLIFKS
ncbi:MAG: YqaE/Pmp3 family membrane protein [Verrucomicrobia bacterium]|nr:YqaE/Pmp3 family membrane protein [Verrucomicrobiota bacterium]MBI3868024.1 YqaE/Pmp3 family membrane protein [Verrucomicrobiota bacterium]